MADPEGTQTEKGHFLKTDDDVQNPKKEVLDIKENLKVPSKDKNVYLSNVDKPREPKKSDKIDVEESTSGTDWPFPPPADELSCEQVASSTQIAEVQIFFRLNKSDLSETKKGKNVLDKILNHLIKFKDYPHNWMIKIDGYADKIGGEYNNEALSWNRAYSVQDYLINKVNNSPNLYAPSLPSAIESTEFIKGHGEVGDKRVDPSKRTAKVEVWLHPNVEYKPSHCNPCKEKLASFFNKIHSGIPSQSFWSKIKSKPIWKIIDEFFKKVNVEDPVFCDCLDILTNVLDSCYKIMNNAQKKKAEKLEEKIIIESYFIVFKRKLNKKFIDLIYDKIKKSLEGLGLKKDIDDYIKNTACFDAVQLDGQIFLWLFGKHLEGSEDLVKKVKVANQIRLVYLVIILNNFLMKEIMVKGEDAKLPNDKALKKKKLEYLKTRIKNIQDAMNSISKGLS